LRSLFDKFGFLFLPLLILFLLLSSRFHPSHPFPCLFSPPPFLPLPPPRPSYSSKKLTSFLARCMVFEVIVFYRCSNGRSPCVVPRHSADADFYGGCIERRERERERADDAGSVSAP
jgi:hypothetical protein